MSKIITLSGWGQPPDALRDIAPGAAHVDYAMAHSVEAALAMLENHADAHTAIGWSMGGQMALRAVAEGVLAPQKLVLIATPLCMPPTTLMQFRDNYVRNATRALNKAYALIAHQDTHGEYIEEKLQEARTRLPAHDWLFWLDALAEHSSVALSLRHVPRTLLIHGDRDAVVDVEQSRRLHALLPEAELHIFEGSGHAPHWHDTARMQKLVAGL